MFFIEGIVMWKLALGFAVFAALVLYALSKGGNIDMGGEKHGMDATHAPAAAPAAASSAAPAAAPPASAVASAQSASSK